MWEAAAHCAGVALARYGDAPPADSFLGHLLASRARLRGYPTPRDLFGHGSDVRQLLWALVGEHGTAAVEATLRRWMRHSGLEMGVEEVGAWAKRLGARMPKAVPLRHRFVVLRIVCNAVCTSCRFRDADVGCLLGCGGYGSDSIRHYLCCPLVCLVAARGRDDRWPANGAM